MLRAFYVYALCLPDGSRCYIGKGKGLRWRDHKRHTTNPFVAEAYRDHGDLSIEIIAGYLTEPEAFALESRLIIEIGRIPSGPLFNLTDGGEGVSGMKHSEETKKRIGMLKVGNKNSVGRIVSVETRALMAARKIGTKQSIDQVEARIGPIRGQRLEGFPDWGRNISAAKTGKARSEQSKENNRKGCRSAEPAVREKIRATLLARNAQPSCWTVSM
jgi:hypothetical protein